MALIGRFGDTTGRPYLSGRVHLPRLAVVADVSFIVDTGADRTHLMPGDGERMGLDYARLQPATIQVTGVGGVTSMYVEPALLVFADAENLYVYDAPITLAPYARELRSVPSLLGRDVLDRWHMTYRPGRGALHFNVDDADLVISLPDGYPPIAPAAGHD